MLKRRSTRPWFHGQWNTGEGHKLGEANFGFDTSAWFQEHILLPFFKQNLKGEKASGLATATMFETGANRWREFASWPPKADKEVTLYMGANEKLLDHKEYLGGASDYVSDPNKPVPHSAHINRGWDKLYHSEQYPSSIHFSVLTK